MAHELPGAGWYHDPWQIDALRWWDGVTWTGWTSSWSARTDQPTIEHRSTTAPPAGLGVAPADGQPIRTADPFEVPCVLVGKTAEWVQPLALFFFAGCALVAILATTFGNHLPIGWKLITGVAVQTALFLLFAAGGFYTLRHPPSLVLSSDRVVIRTRFRSTEVPWQDVTGVVLKVHSGEGVNWVWPAIERRNGKTILIGALVESPRNRQRASETVDRLLATLDAQLSTVDRESRSPS